MELRIQELTNLIKNKKHKIVDDFLNILPEKKLIQQLITTYLEFKKAEKQRIPSRKLKKEFQKIEYELEDKLGEGFMENIQLILKDCEELVVWETELEERLNAKTLLIEEREKTLQIISGNDKENIVKELHNELKSKKEELKVVRKLINDAITTPSSQAKISEINASSNNCNNEIG
ncbi:23726_t:CDS:2, partial [Dentiscutata erythropus]